MSEDTSAGEKFREWVKANHARQPSFGAEVRALSREAVKDLRSTMHEVFFGQAEHASEPGTPLNPTTYETAKDRTRTASNPAGTSVEAQQPQSEKSQQEKQQGMDSHGREM